MDQQLTVVAQWIAVAAYTVGVWKIQFRAYFVEHVYVAWPIIIGRVLYIKGVALQYILYSDLRPWSKRKSKVKVVGQRSNFVLCTARLILLQTAV